MTLRVPRTLVYRFNDSSNVYAPSMSKGRLDFEKDAGWPEAQAHCLDGGKERPTARVDATAQTSQALTPRARIVPACQHDGTNREIGRQLRVTALESIKR